MIYYSNRNANIFCYIVCICTIVTYVTIKLSETKGYKIGDTLKWHIYGDKKYYESKIVGYNRNPQNQILTASKEYIESLGVKYNPDSLYTNYDLKNVKEINNVSLIQDLNSLKEGMETMLSMMKKMILLIIVFAILLGSIIIYNMGILSYNEKQYQFSTLKVLGFKDKIFIKQNILITILSVMIGLPSGKYLTKWIFKACLDEAYDFGVYINISTYVIATVMTLLVSYIVSVRLAKNVNKIDMVKSLKSNE